MPFRIATAVIAGLFCAILGTWAFARNPRGIANRYFALFNLPLAIWNFAELTVYIEDHQRALALYRFCYVVGSFIAFSFLKFLFSVMKREISWPYRLINWLTYLLALLSTTNLIIKDIQYSYRQPSPIVEVDGSLYNLFILFFISTLAYSLYGLIRSYRDSSGVIKNQLRYVALAICLAIVGIIIFIANQLNEHVLPLHYLIEMGISSIFAYAIFKYHLMDIRVFVWRAGLLIVVYVALLILAAPLVVLLHQRVITPSGISSGLLALEAISVGAVLSLGPFLYAYFVRQSSFFHEYTLAGLTHELKSPLAAIESALEIINEQKKLKPGSAKEKEFLEMIERNSTRLQRFTSDLIHVFGDKKNLGSLEMAELNDLCQKGVDSFLSQANSKNTQIEFFPLQSNPSVSCDAAKVEQVISNLVSNAVKFTDGGKIFVKLKEEPAHFLVEVGDTGKGIPPEELPYVFDRFFQGEAGRRAKGTGIGLAIAKTWVEAHGGKIYAESEGEGKGSLFHFTLPKRN